jgi:peptidoglycan/LPS O-acetylase OafA/YrhL
LIRACGWNGLANGFEDVSSTADDENMKGASIVFAVLAGVGASLAALFCLVAVGLGGDHRPTTGGPYLLTAAVFATAFFAWRAVRSIARDQPERARTELLRYAVLGGILVLYGLYASVHSDGKLLSYGLANEVCVFFAFMLMPADARPTTEMPKGS